MAEQPEQQQMKTSFLFIQLQAPLARAHPSQSPATAAWTAAPGGLEEGHIFPSPRTGFLAGRDLRHTQGLAAPPSRLLQKGGSGTEEPAAFSCSALKEEEREEKSQDLDVRRGGVCRTPRHRPSPAPASRKFGRLQPLSCRLRSPAPVMSNESNNPSMGWEHWPVITAPQDLWSKDPSSWDALGCSMPQVILAHATDRGESTMLRRGVATCQILPKSCEEGISTTVQARRARLYRYCPPIQTSKSYPALPAALPLKAETFVWVNNASSHSQSVAKAKYEFLFGISKEKPPDTSDHGGSTLLPPNVTNEFPEYGTMEDSGEGLRTSLGFDTESLPGCPQGQLGVQLLHGHQSGLESVTEGPKDVRESLSQSHLKEQSLQPIDSLISTLKATEARKASGTLQATKVLDKDAISSFSVQQVDKELDTVPHKTKRQGAKKLFPPGQEKAPDIPLSAEVTTEENFYLSIQKDQTVLLTGEAQAQLSKITNNGRKGAVHVQEPACSISSLGSPAVTHTSAGSVALLREKRSDQGSSTGRPGRVKHVEFQGVEILWTGGEKREIQHPVDFEISLERSTSPENRELSRVPTHLISCAGLYNSVGLTESVWDETWRSSEKLGTSSGTFSPLPLVESGEDEVFLKENKEHLEKKPELERDKERILEQEEHFRGGDDDVLGPAYTEDSTDVYSSQFETILDNTSLYYSAESLETLYSEPDSYFSFEMPLTPMIQQRIKEGSQFLERTTVAGQQDVLSVSADGGIVMGYSSGITNGLNDTSDSIYTKGTPEIAFWGSNAGVKTALLETHSEMGSTEILEKETSESLSNGTSSNIEAAKRLAKRLYQLDRFKRSDVAKHLGKNNEFSKLVAEEYLKFFDFTGMTLDQSLRYFFKAFSLVGETQERERVLIHFSNRYFYCNPDTIASQDGVHCLTCAMMLLNTDLHGHNIGKKMTCQEFIANLQGVNEGGDFSKDLLKALYNSIKNEKLEWAVDDEEKKKSPTEGTDEKANGTHPKTISRIGSTTNPFLDIPHDPNAAIYKSGFLARKIHADMDGKKSHDLTVPGIEPSVSTDSKEPAWDSCSLSLRPFSTHTLFQNKYINLKNKKKELRFCWL
ncbi:PH and SEC7 domain-containing protein 3 isoform X4 [Panthera uncia]|uniref:PH and SEC7 domain-containing protein 3 isoform X4 n=1 Tax=Panthera uncia TaxID=29064 RepID=UPI0020FFA6AB|nr:PH and SEC7 domain-containing protein 3 isoform X4 [Panthera uncia]